MRDTIAQVLLFLRGLWRYRWPAVIAAWAVALAGWIVVQSLPDRYTSKTQVYVDTESLLRPLLSGLAVNRDVMSQVGMMQAVMLSRPNLEKVAQQTDLLLAASDRADQEAVIDSLASRVVLGRSTGPAVRNTFELSFEDPNPKTAQRVVRALLDNFMESSLGLKTTDTAVAQEFIEQQVKDYERRLLEAENRLATFKQQNVGLMPGSGGGYFQRMEAELARMQQLRQTFTESQTRRDELYRQLQGEEPTFGLLGSADGSPIDGQIARFKAQRDQLLLQYTDKHPQVQSLNDTIQRLEAEKRAGAKVSSTVAAPGAGMTDGEAVVRSLDMNPVYQNLRLALSQADADLAAVRGQLMAQQTVINELQGRIRAVPEVEAELTRLNRDYDINKKQYESLQQRLESAKLSEDAEQSSEDVKFRIIEPPVVPVKASGPPRPLLNSLVLVVALGVGGGLALVLMLLHPTIFTREGLEKVTGLPVLGALSIVRRPEELAWRRRQIVLVSSALGSMLVLFTLNQLLSETIRAALRGSAG